jgi:uncharacterized protein
MAREQTGSVAARPSRARRILRSGTRIALAAYVAGGVLLFFGQRELLYPGQHRHPAQDPAGSVPGLQVYWTPTSAGRIEAWYLPPLAHPVDGPAPALIFAHGNGEIIDDWINVLTGFRQRGIGVMLVEYPGYGRSDGSPSEDSITTAMVAAYDVLAKRPDIDPRRIVAYGQSLGGGAACAWTRQRSIAALILQSTFTSVRTFAKHYLMPEFLVRDPFDNLETLRGYPGPVLIIHGQHDELIPFEQGVALAQEAAHSTLRLYDCGHWCWYPDTLPFWSDAVQFLASNGILTRP